MAPLVVKQLPVLPRNGWSKVRWSDDPSHQALRVWRDADADISEMFYLPMDTDDDDNEGPIEWIAVTPSDTPFFFPPGQKEEGFYYQTDFRAWLARYVSKKTRDSDIYKARHFSMPVGKDGISVARLAVSPALFLACCLLRDVRAPCVAVAARIHRTGSGRGPAPTCTSVLRRIPAPWMAACRLSVS